MSTLTETATKAGTPKTEKPSAPVTKIDTTPKVEPKTP